jgi:hypothetical protein
MPPLLQNSEAQVIVLDKHRALIDETVAIRVQGFPPRQPVTITATQTLYGSSRWQAHAILQNRIILEVADSERPFQKCSKEQAEPRHWAS